MVAVDDNPEQAEAFVGDAAPMLLFDPNWDVAHRYGTFQIPETYLLVNGDVKKKFIGSTDWSQPEVRAEVTKYLQIKVPPAPTTGAGAP